MSNSVVVIRRDREVPTTCYQGETPMRFMLIVKPGPKSEAGAPPDAAMLESMGKFNEEISKAGVLLDLAGLHPSKEGARVHFSGQKRTVIDGPFAETKEL